MIFSAVIPGQACPPIDVGHFFNLTIIDSIMPYLRTQAYANDRPAVSCVTTRAISPSDQRLTTRLWSARPKASAAK